MGFVSHSIFILAEPWKDTLLLLMPLKLKKVEEGPLVHCCQSQAHPALLNPKAEAFLQHPLLCL